jgi:hypothetical protein
VAREFMLDDAFFTGIQGPVGSGKSSAACMKIMKAATEMPKNRAGIRRSKWAVVRNTYPELKTTTIETWLEWFPEQHFGRFIWTPPFTHVIRFADVELEVVFLALDTEADVGKLLSLDLTGAWINEAREIPKGILDAATLRLGRFPPRREVDTFWYGLIADTNAPPDDHWFAIMSGQSPVPEHFTDNERAQMVKPDDWNFYLQPGAAIETRDSAGRTTGWELNPKAENLDHLPKNYYKNAMTGKTNEYIRVFIGNKVGSARAGQPVYGNFSAQLHVASADMAPDPRLPILLGFDFGLTPAFVMAQRYTDLSWLVFDEFTSRDVGFRELARHAKDRLGYWSRMAGTEFEYRAWGDPAGDARSPYDDQKRTAFQLLEANGLIVKPAPSNDPVLRIEAVDSLLTTLIDGHPLLTLSPRTRVLIRGFEEGYQYKKKRGMESVGTEDKPDKNQYSHPHDALQYLVMGEGVGRDLKRRQRINHQGQYNARTSWNPYDRQTGLANRPPRLRS